MLDHQTILVSSVIDIINVRMLVRQAARRMGMKLIDQSRISLATSSLADAVGLGTGLTSGQVSINCLHKNLDGREGLQIVCQYHSKNGVGIQPNVTNIRWMVDECNVRALSSTETEIALIKWIN